MIQDFLEQRFSTLKNDEIFILQIIENAESIALDQIELGEKNKETAKVEEFQQVVDQTEQLIEDIDSYVSSIESLKSKICMILEDVDKNGEQSIYANFQLLLEDLFTNFEKFVNLVEERGTAKKFDNALNYQAFLEELDYLQYRTDHLNLNLDHIQRKLEELHILQLKKETEAQDRLRHQQAMELKRAQNAVRETELKIIQEREALLDKKNEAKNAVNEAELLLQQLEIKQQKEKEEARLRLEQARIYSIKAEDKHRAEEKRLQEEKREQSLEAKRLLTEEIKRQRDLERERERNDELKA